MLNENPLYVTSAADAALLSRHVGVFLLQSLASPIFSKFHLVSRALPRTRPPRREVPCPSSNATRNLFSDASAGNDVYDIYSTVLPRRAGHAGGSRIEFEGPQERGLRYSNSAIRDCWRISRSHGASRCLSPISAWILESRRAIFHSARSLAQTFRYACLRSVIGGRGLR